MLVSTPALQGLPLNAYCIQAYMFKLFLIQIDPTATTIPPRGNQVGQQRAGEAAGLLAAGTRTNLFAPGILKSVWLFFDFCPSLSRAYGQIVQALSALQISFQLFFNQDGTTTADDRNHLKRVFDKF